jgi:antibiotic biosynthesis monooxygenase (ABM) superfamily enzyme
MNESGSHSQPADSDPVTYIIRRRVKPERQAEFEAWLTGINQAATEFEGRLGVNVIRPTDPATADYVIIWRFNCYANLKKWEDSPVRQEWLDKSWQLTEGTPDIQKLTGLEFWFTPPPGTAAANPPPRYKMAIVVMLGLYPLVLALRLILTPWLEPFPDPIKTLIIVIIAVLIMTYFLIPLLTRLLARWLYPHC